MFETIRNSVVLSRNKYSPDTRSRWVTQWPAQVVICVSQIIWTSEVHKELKEVGGSVGKYQLLCQTQVNDLVEIIRGEIPAGLRATLGALVTVEVHARDIVKELAAKGLWKIDLLSFPNNQPGHSLAIVRHHTNIQCFAHICLGIIYDQTIVTV